MEAQNNQTTTSLQSHVAHLTNLVERVNTLRKIPGLLLAPSTLTGSQLEQGFAQIHDLKTTVSKNPTQEYLKHAQESFSKNEEGVSLDGRRQSRKRRRPPSPIPESPRPPPALPERTFPPTPRLSPLTLSDLPSYVRDQNRSESVLKLHIWTPTRPRHRTQVQDFISQQSAGVILRVNIQDVLYAYVRLGVPTVLAEYSHDLMEDRMEETPQAGRLIIESVSVFGPREQKSPHSQSDFVVFQKLTQYVASMIQAEPDVELQSVVALFKSYESLFVAQCTICHRILSEEGHFPPVCRIWTPARRGRDATSAVERESGISVEDNDTRWEPRHRSCFGGIR